MKVVQKSVVLVGQFESKSHTWFRRTKVYQRLGHVTWLNWTVKKVISTVLWLVLAVVLLELTIGVSGMMFMYWLLHVLVK